MSAIRYMTESVPGFVKFLDTLHEKMFPESAKRDLIDLAARIEEKQLKQSIAQDAPNSVQSESNHPHWTIAETITAALTDYALSNDIAELSHNQHMLFSSETKSAFRLALSSDKGMKGWLQLQKNRFHLDTDTSLHNSMEKLFNVIRFNSSASHISANFGLGLDDNQLNILASLLSLIGISEGKTQDLSTALAKPTALSFMNALDKEHAKNYQLSASVLRTYVTEYYQFGDLKGTTNYADHITCYEANNILAWKLGKSDGPIAQETNQPRRMVYECLSELVELTRLQPDTLKPILSSITVDAEHGVVHIVLGDNHPKWHVDHVDQQVLDIINKYKKLGIPFVFHDQVTWKFMSETNYPHRDWDV